MLGSLLAKFISTAQRVLVWFLINILFAHKKTVHLFKSKHYPFSYKLFFELGLSVFLNRPFSDKNLSIKNLLQRQKVNKASKKNN
jgi:hypothetical protein